MASLESLTVAELKLQLRAKGLPVSGKKSELIARLISSQEDEGEGEEEELFLEDEDEPSQQDSTDDSLEVGCPSCGELLSVPSDYSGRAKCPDCDYVFVVSDNTESPAASATLSGKVSAGEYEEFKPSAGQKFVMGPDGEMIEVVPFNWLYFLVGVFGPYLVMGVFYLMAVFSESYDVLLVGYWVGPISGISAAVYGFVNGNKALGIGALIGTIVVPLIGIAACFMVIFIAFGM